MNRTALLAAVATLTAVLLVTISPPALRPGTGHPQLERFAAWALVGALSSRAFPRRLAVMAVVVTGLAIGSEAAQLAAAGRHARLADGAAKGLGALAGVLSGFLPGHLLNATAARPPQT